MPEGNPAARLHHVIETLFEHSGNSRMSSVLRLLAEPDDDVARKKVSDADVLRMFGGVVALPAQIRTVVDQLSPDDEDVEHLADPLDNVERALTEHGPNGTRQKYGQIIDGTDRSNLRHLRKALDRNGWRERTVETDQLKDLRAKVSAMFDEVAEADLDDDLRRFVLRHLEAIERGIRHYQVEGAPPLDDAIDAFHGDVLRDVGEEHRRGLARFIQEDAVGRQLLRLVGEVNGAVHLATWTIAAAGGVPLLPPG